ncbi:MAG: heparinase II/III family protein [Opitutales bacterium]|nr:heparinase II/III family protein [Opitutales bacterium]
MNIKAEAALFFEPKEVERIRRSARSPLLGSVFADWEARPADELIAEFEDLRESEDLHVGVREGCSRLREAGIVQIVEPRDDLKEAILTCIDVLLRLPEWDFLMDGPYVIGVQRASLISDTLLFLREVLGDDWSEDLNRKVLDYIAEKACVPLHRTIHGMDNPDEVIGWRVADGYPHLAGLDMSRWPMILGGNNLRAVPTASLGIAALALSEHDDRAEQWLEKAISSSFRVLALFKEDGSFFEGVGYTNYTLRTLLNFFDAHMRAVGDIDWVAKSNLDGTVRFLLGMQAGLRPDGSPEPVNFGDSGANVFPCVPGWISKHTNNPVAQYLAEKASQPRSFRDMLWYDPDLPSKAPPPSLMNLRTRLEWIFCRTGWEPEDAVLAFRGGGPSAHEHADRNHFLFKIHGERLLTDHFGAAYHYRDPGFLLRLTEGHNSVLVGRKGQQYHQGEEGTNDGLSFANTVHYQDQGAEVWWTSDATAAYRIDNYHIFKVVRSLIYFKPDIIVVFDQVRLRYRPQQVDLRFFPENRDGAAEFELQENNRFTIRRPKARLHGQVFAHTEPEVRLSELEVPRKVGHFPCIEVGTPKALDHEILTVLCARSQDQKDPPASRVEKQADTWKVEVGRLRASILTSRRYPRILVG